MDHSRLRIPLSVPNIGNREVDAVVKVLKAGWVSYAGPEVGEFECALASTAGAESAVATCSGTAALHIALVIAGVKPGDEVVMPALTFIAPANAVKYVGACPVFIDVREGDWQADFCNARKFLENGCRRDREGALRNRVTHRRVSALLPVHILGGMVDVDAWAQLADEFKLWLIEDAAEAMGASYKARGIGAPVGTDIDQRRFVCTSFNGNKVITTGGGGAIFANKNELIQRAKHLCTTAKTNSIEFEHDQVGFNYRMTNMAAAMGLAQVERLTAFVDRKKEIAAAYDNGLAGTVLQPHPRQKEICGTFWLYTVRMPGGSRGLIKELINSGIDVRPIWRLMNTLTPHADGFCYGKLKTSELLWNECLSLPSSTNLTNQVINSVINKLVTSLNN